MRPTPVDGLSAHDAHLGVAELLKLDRTAIGLTMRWEIAFHHGSWLNG